MNCNFNLAFPLSKKTLLIILLIHAMLFKVSAQEQNNKPVSPRELESIIDSISSIVKRYYIDPEVGARIAKRITRKNDNGDYNQITDPRILADSLKNDLRAINGDLHMNMVYRAPRTIAKPNEAAIQVNRSGIWSNYGLNEVKVLDGNIGYLKIKHFTRHKFLEDIKPTIATTFEFLKNTDAVIVDVRNNGGGFEDMVAHYISYFFDSKKPIHLSDYRCTLHDHVYGISTDLSVLGPKLPDIKLYVLVNANTGSAAESFAYMLKHLKRATIIGEITAGAGNGASYHEVNDRFSVEVSSEETINAITKTSFEKVGVIPHIETTSKQAFNKGYKLALEHAKKNNKRNIHFSNYDNLISFIASPKTNKPEDYLKYAGTYEGRGIRIIITVENNLLFGQVASKGGKMELVQLEDHIFKVGEIKERIQFILDEKGNVIKLKGIDSPMELNKLSKN